MPFISSKGMYGIRAMYELSKFPKQKLIPVSKIVEITGILQNYLEQIFEKLSKAKLLMVQRWVNSGYNLASFSSKIFIKDIILPLKESQK